MITIRSVAVLVTVLCAFCRCSKADRSSASEMKDWPLKNVETMPAKITVLSGTTFRCGAVPCQLLGVKEADDPAVRKRAEEFTKAWFKSIGNYIILYNSSNPLVTKERVAVVWICGSDCYHSCLSEELIRAGLARLEDSSWKGYTFTVPTKKGAQKEDWQGILRKAKEGNERGEKLRVLFEWPPK
jgi:hypothetical protein